ncbi:hypothetical protein MRX96_020047 [Rhipicephalus microplus]
MPVKFQCRLLAVCCIGRLATRRQHEKIAMKKRRETGGEGEEGVREKRGQRQLIACADRPGQPCDTTAETLAAGRHSVSAGRPRGLSAASPRRGGSRRHHKHQPRPHRCRRPLHLAAHGCTPTARPQQRTPAVALTRGLASNITCRSNHRAAAQIRGAEIRLQRDLITQLDVRSAKDCIYS